MGIDNNLPILVPSSISSWTLKATKDEQWPGQMRRHTDIINIINITDWFDSILIFLLISIGLGNKL